MHLRSPAAERSAQLETALCTVGPSCGGDEGFLLRKYLPQGFFYFDSSSHRFFYFYLSLSSLHISIPFLSMAFLPFAFTSSSFLPLFIPFFPRSFISSFDIFPSLLLRFLSSIVLFLFCSFYSLSVYIFLASFFCGRFFYLLSSPSPGKFLHTLQRCYETSTL